LFSGALFFGAFDGLETKTINWRYNSQTFQNPENKIVLVLITDECLSRLGIWPISRANYAEVIDKISAAGASLIAFDMVFEDNYTQDLKGDEKFVNSSKKFGNVIFPIVFSEFKVFEDFISLPNITQEARLPFKKLSEAAAGFGYVNADFDYLNSDGIFQKTFLTHKFGERWISCFSLAIAEQFKKQQISISNNEISFSGKKIPIIDLPKLKSSKTSWNSENSKAVFINYLSSKNHKPFLSYSFADIFKGKFDSESFRNAIVLIGPSAVGLGDLKLTPYGLQPGVIIHANLLENILSENYLTPLSINFRIIINAIFSLITLVLLLWRGSFAFVTAILGIFLGGYVSFCFIAFSEFKLIFPIVTPVLMVVFQYISARFFQLITNLKESNIILAEQNFKLDLKVNELLVLHDSGKKFPSILETKILAKEIITDFCNLREAEAGLLVYFENEIGQYQPLGQFSKDGFESVNSEQQKEVFECLKQVFFEKKVISFSDSRAFTSYLPLMKGESCWGAICFRETKENNMKLWQGEHFWTTLLGISVTALENARLYEMAREVSLAQQIQANFLPQKPLEFNGYIVSGYSRPATQLGGDYFDYFIVENRYLVVLIADVMGHGVPAALGMTIVKTSVLQRAIENFSVIDLAETINSTLLSNPNKKLMVTAQFFVIDTFQHCASIYHRGHVFPLRKSVAGKWAQQKCKIAPPLGVKKHSDTPETIVEVLPGERWMLFTDGLYESLDESLEDEMRITTLCAYLESLPHVPIDQACYDVITNHPSIITGQPQPDDFTVLLIERVPIV
jgi:CHASE2 domain-containing sensor protein